ERLFSSLTEKDRDIVAGVVFPGGWYPTNTFGRCLTAVFEVLGEKNPENARTWGKIFGGKIFSDVYKEISYSVADDVPDALKRFILISKTFFSASSLELIALDRQSARLRVTRVPDLPAVSIYFHVLSGCLEAYIELAGGGNARGRIFPKPKTTIKRKWLSARAGIDRKEVVSER
ncbi:MAG: hypothetical protein NT056_01455, partial [Proteobacteria bacterium]|nr:hypothetical protein [Pseudomonadota bacterium]